MKVQSKYLNSIIKALLFIGLGYALYKQVFTNTNVREALQTLKVNLIHGRGWFVIVLLLTIVNWSLEALKWQFLVRKFEHITFFRSLVGILFGISFSLFTPNRLGEYGGRVLVLTHHRLIAIVSTLVGSYSQIVVNMSIGGLACLIYLWNYVHLHIYFWITIFFIYILLALFLFISFFNLEIVSVFFKKYSIFKKIATYTEIIGQYNSKDLKTLLAYSSFRYGIYCIQFLLLLKVFRTGVNWLDGLVLIPNVFFLQGILPTMAILDISLRGQIALQIIGGYASGEMIDIIAASVVLWFINLIIPSIAGGIFAIFYKFSRGNHSS
ncbi:MAG: flippase-like domain-containing protein [Chitinophagales bacterium]|nr:flippase-like domain-containing protein [Chitinophagales bacterium]MCZ2394495.1 flippase-like domain-containing protein [Chitinophagales bacterium]